MPSYKELRAQGLQANLAAYPLPARNSAGESVYIYQRVKWTGNFLDAELEHIEVPAHNCPSFTTTTQPERLAPEDRDEKGLFPARPENLPGRPQRPSEDTVRERAFSKLITTERSLTVDEKMARDSQYLVELQKWRSWASRMPEEWNLLDPAEYKQLNSMMPTASESQVYKPNMDNDTQIFWVFLLFGVISYLCGAPVGQLVALALLAIAVVQINHQNSLNPIALFNFAVLNPISVMYLLGYWILRMIGVVVLVISSAVTSILWLFDQVATSSAGANSGSRTAFCNTVPTLRASTTLTGHSGVTYADPLSTPQSVSIESLPESLRPKPLIENFGTLIRGPLSKDFGARRTPDGLHTVQPSFFTTPPRPTFT
ncbi:unnamed protein product [Aureobasidium uvarum]|uniref:Uncharacterized protein n=1 Tax=Aureobasidium uvarum TaxID=2773716 RepID=A0A9N8PW51_9PEZI|nr:unnamed protein product [Aureobasidium uvarum]